MELTNQGLLEQLQVFSTQNQQMIDILMMLLADKDPNGADLVDFAHNVKNVFLSDLTKQELTELMAEFESSKIDGV